MSERSDERRQSRFESQWDSRCSARSAEVERLERDSFILLQHAYTVTGATAGRPVNATRLGHDLGFAEDEASRLINYLNWVGYLKESAAGPHLSLAPEGIEYLEERAGRRHSVRAPPDQPIPIPFFLG